MPGSIIDTAGPVRGGEELDLAAIDNWLKQRRPELAGAPELTQYSGGASNWTYRLRYDNADLILRRPPAGTKAKSAHDMSREFRVQQALAPVFPYVPEMIAHCSDPAVAGEEFYVMRRVPGIILRRNPPRGLELSPEQARTMCTNMLDTLIALHKVDTAAAGLDPLGKGAGYARRQIDGWCGRYEKAHTWNVPKAAAVMRWLQGNLPDSERITLIHNDYRFDNLVLDAEDPTRILAVLDWEMATLGDPLMDVGNSLAYWIEPSDSWMSHRTRRQPTHLPGMMTRAELVAYYSEKTGWKPDNWAFYEVYGLFRLAVIIQQIYYRYHHKQTRNPKFRHFWILVHHLLRRARTRMRG